MLKYLNNLKRKTLGFLTGSIGNDQHFYDALQLKEGEIKKVLIIRPNHRLGNQLLVSPLIQEVANTFEGCKIDLFLKGGLGEILYKNYTCIDRYICLPKNHFKELHNYLYSWVKLRSRNYDLVINVAPGSSSGKLATKFSKGRYKLYGDFTIPSKMPEDNNHMAKKPVYNFRLFAGETLGKPMNSEVPTLDIGLNQKEVLMGEKILQDLFGNNKPSISIFTFATGPKCYSEKWWEQFYIGFKKKYGASHNILEILPKENSSQINFQAVSFYSKDVREMAAVIKNSVIFISADSGIMHLASSVGKPVIGLFSCTNMEMYQPYGNNSIAVNTNKHDANYIIGELARILEA